jgi:glyoxylase-like metal-dependent hydrolase (beta-lactamase superfamily II)
VPNLKATVAWAAIIGMMCAHAAHAETDPAAPATANAVSLDPDAPNSYLVFAPELERTVARMPQLDPATGLYVEEVKPNLFYVTDGVYQSAFALAGEGVIVFDAPSSFAAKLPAMIAEHAQGESLKYLLYSHSHADHVGGSTAFDGVEGLAIVAPAAVADAIRRERHPGILEPTVTFEDEYSFRLGREVVQIKTAHFHSENMDAIIYLPGQKFVVAVDTITPGEVPFMNFGTTARFGGYVDVLDAILSYDFDTILSGHTSILGAREDVVLSRDYVHDVRNTALKGMEGMLPAYANAFVAFGFRNGNLAYRVAIEGVRKDCTRQIIDRWKDKLSVVDVWAHSHCETVILHAIMH